MVYKDRAFPSLFVKHQNRMRKKRIISPHATSHDQTGTWNAPRRHHRYLRCRRNEKRTIFYNKKIRFQNRRTKYGYILTYRHYNWKYQIYDNIQCKYCPHSRIYCVYRLWYYNNISNGNPIITTNAY